MAGNSGRPLRGGRRLGRARAERRVLALSEAEVHDLSFFVETDVERGQAYVQFAPKQCRDIVCPQGTVF